jgi:hypothetical protein
MDMVVGWKRSRGKRWSEIELNFGVTFTVCLVTITYAKCRQEKYDLDFLLHHTFPTNVSLSPFCFCCHVPEPTIQATPVYLNSIQIVVWYIIDIYLYVPCRIIAHRNLGEFVRYD